jgi:hypothetical protein
MSCHNADDGSRSGIYAEVGGVLSVRDIAEGGGTDAAFAALRHLGPGHRALGPARIGSHSNNAEYVDLGSIEPRRLLPQMISDVSTGRRTEHRNPPLHRPTYSRLRPALRAL